MSSLPRKIQAPNSWDLSVVDAAVFNSKLDALERRFVAPRKREDGPWLTEWRVAHRGKPPAQGGVYEAVVSPTISTQKQLHRFWSAVNRAHAEGYKELLITLRDTRRLDVQKIVANYFRSCLIRGHRSQYVLLWWVPPLSNSSTGAAWVCLGEPDLLYLTEGIEDGLARPEIRITGSIAPFGFGNP